MPKPLRTLLSSKTAVTLCLILSFTACTHNPFNKSSTLGWLLENQRYDEAIALYPKLEKEKQVPFDILQIEKDREVFILQSLRDSRRATARKQWLEAQGILESALIKTPNSHALQTEIAVLNQRMSKLEAQYLVSLQLLIAQQYIERQPIDEKWILVSKDRIPYIHPSLSNKGRREVLAETLGEYGRKLLSSTPKEAKVYLETASQLSPDQRWTTALSKINQSSVKKAKKAQRKQQKIRELAFSDLQTNFNQHFDKKHYISAGSSLEHAANVAKSNTEKSWVKIQQRKLNKSIQEKVDSALKRGQYSYSKGRIDEAISIWKQALTLSPNNRQLKDSLARAKKFKETYESLK